MLLDPPPPAFIQKDDYNAADPARKRLNSTSPFPRFLSLPNLRAWKYSDKTASLASPETDTLQQVNGQESRLIVLDPLRLNDMEEQQDKYEWAIVYENQRGITLFSIPYYSHLSLLPSDPSPFTIPNTSRKRSEQPSISLTNYPLPDGNWRWVSKCWMIDMRSDSGEVQHDGFEYNWAFRTHRWRSEVGTLSSGGWVRRRRWVRLMMRPARKFLGDNHGQTPNSTARGSFDDVSQRQQDSGTSSFSRSSTMSKVVTHLEDIWSTDDSELNWTKYQLLMKHVGRDGRKLEIWKTWLGQNHDNAQTWDSKPYDRKGKTRQQLWSEDDTFMSSKYEAKDILTNDIRSQLKIPPKEYIISMLGLHGKSLLRSFMFPDSRAEFLKMLDLAGLLPELGMKLGITESEVEFWSYDEIMIPRDK